ncbi:MAG: hypothetical protein WD398_08300 [Cyclobacteriaceae bacterium]
MTSLQRWFYEKEKGFEWCFAVLFTGSLFLRPFVHKGNLMIIDADLYLEIASQVYQGVFIQNFITADPSLYWHWPMGFPFLVGLFSFLFEGDVFFAGRVLQSFFFGMILILLKKSFPIDWGFYLALISTGTFLGLFLSTMTEAGFIAFGFLMLYLVLKENKSWLPIFLTMVSLYAFRHVGLFVGGFVLWHYWKEERDNRWLGVLLAFSMVVLSYSFLEYQANSKLTGAGIEGEVMGRMKMLGLWVIATLAYFSYFDVEHFGGRAGKVLFFIGLVPMLLAAIWGFERVWNNKKQDSKLIRSYTRFGMAYFVVFLLVLLVLGWDHQGWGIQGRYIAPGAVFLLIALFESYRPMEGYPWKLRALFKGAAMCMVLYNGYFQAYLDSLSS